MEQKAKIFKDGDNIIIVVPKTEEAIISSVLLSVCRGEVSECVVKDVAPVHIVESAPNIDDAIPVFLQDEDESAESTHDTDLKELEEYRIKTASWRKAVGKTIKEVYESDAKYFSYLVDLNVSETDPQKFQEHQLLKKYFEVRKNCK